jgi:tight adherence protein B
MSAIDLAIGVGTVMTIGWLVFLVRRGRPRTRFARLSRESELDRGRGSERGRGRGPGAGHGAAGDMSASGAAGMTGAVDGTASRAAASDRWRRRVARLGDRAAAALIERPVASGLAFTSFVGGAVLLLAGPVASIAIALYAAVAIIGGHRSLIRRATDRAVTELLDAIDAASGDLRAGIVPGGPTGGLPTGFATTFARREDGGSRRREDVAVQVAVSRLEAAQRISSALGMPLADLLDRVDADLRAGQALRVGIAAQTSSAQATTVLLLGLPLVGLWLGAALGTDPIRQLLHTPLGAACAMVAVALQCTGLLWTGRMIHAVTTEVR